jgi:hypothetical protein
VGKKQSPSTLIFQTGAVAAGDIIFVYDQHPGPIKRLKRIGNVIGQKLLISMRKQDSAPSKGETRNYSHVMLGVGNGLIIHADGTKVTVEPMSEALDYETDERSIFQVFRREDLSPETANAIAKEGTRYYAQKYRFSSFFTSPPEQDTTQFCSRLVAHAFSSAGIALTDLADNKVLPLDLYRICLCGGWKDVTEKFVAEAPSTASDEVLPKIRLEGQDLPLSEFLKKADALIAKSASLSAQTMEVMHEANRNLLINEALLAKLCGAQFDLAKALRLHPSGLEDQAAGMIARVLQQMQAVLDLSELPDIELLLGDALLNSDPEDKDAKLYIGYPTPLAIREMQISRETIRMYAYLLFAQVGLCVIVAHRVPHDPFAAYRSVDKKYADQFIAALEPVDNLAPYEKQEELFKWIDSDTDRAAVREIFRTIVSALKIINILRGVSASW